MIRILFIFFLTVLVLGLVLLIKKTSTIAPIKQTYTTYATRLMVAKNKRNRTPSEKKMQSGVLEVFNQYLANGSSFTIPAVTADQDFLLEPSFAKIDDSDRVYMYIYLRNQGPLDSLGKPTKPISNTVFKSFIQAFKDTMASFKVYVTDPNIIDPLNTNKPFYPFVQAWVPAKNIDNIAKFPMVMHLALVTEPMINDLPPIFASGRTRSDISSSIWKDSSAAYGVKVGIISDDCGSIVEQGMGKSPLDSTLNLGVFLPGRQWLPDNTLVHVFSDDWNGERSHEGLAMMEVVHDVAPKAQLYFATGIGNLGLTPNNNMGMLNFIHSMDLLAFHQCNVITDDIQYIEEPAFEDGPIAEEINLLTGTSSSPTDSKYDRFNSTKKPVIYTSAAGNWAHDVFSFTFDSLQNQKIGITDSWESYTIQNTMNHVYRDSFGIKTGSTIDVMLQWDDPYQFPVAGNDFDLCLVDVATNRIVQWSTNIQNGANTNNDCLPFEHFSYYADPCFGRKGYKLYITRDAIGHDNPTPRMKLLIRGLNDADMPSNAKSLFGHAAADGCIACGAVNPTGDCDLIEDFSSLGPVEIVQTDQPAIFTNGFWHRPLIEKGLRTKPDLCAVDGVATTVRPLEYFRGTSASAPIVAALAARILGLPASPRIAAQTAMDNLLHGCIHYGEAGKNNTYGYGRADAFVTFAQAMMRAGNDNNFAQFQNDPHPLAATLGAVEDIIVTNSALALPENAYVSATIEKYISGPITLKLIAQSPSGTVISNLIPDLLSGSSMQNLNAVFHNGAAPLTSLQIPCIGMFGFTPTLPASTLPAVQTKWTLLMTYGSSATTTPIKNWGLYFRK